MKVRRRFATWGDDQGQALAEFAMVLPMILFFIAAILEFGRAWNIKQAVTDAAREGARYTVVFNTTMSQSDVINKVKERLALSSIDSSIVTISSPDPFCTPLSTCFHAPLGQGREMTVTVSTQYRMGLVHVLMRWAGLPTTVTIATNSTMRNE